MVLLSHQGRRGLNDSSSLRPSREGLESLKILPASRLLWEKAFGIRRRRPTTGCQEGIAAEFLLAGDPDPGNPASIPRTTRLLASRRRRDLCSAMSTTCRRCWRKSTLLCCPATVKAHRAACLKPLPVACR